MDGDMLIEMEEDDDIEEEDFEADEDYEDEEYYEDEEVDGLIPVEMSRVSSLVTDDTSLQEAVAINEDLNGYEGRQHTGGGHGGNKESSRGEIDVCPICFQLWSSDGDHRICCLPCGHIYGMSCINKWLQRCQGSGKCPQCNNLCTLEDVRVLYATRLCVIDEELHKRERSLEAKCAYLEAKVQMREEKIMEGMREEIQLQLERLREEEIYAEVRTLSDQMQRLKEHNEALQKEFEELLAREELARAREQLARAREEAARAREEEARAREEAARAWGEEFRAQAESTWKEMQDKLAALEQMFLSRFP